MQQSRIFKYIQALPSRERDRFQQFVYSPYFNQHEKTQELLEILLAANDEKDKSLERPQLFRRLFPGEPYEEQKLHNIMSYLMKLYQRFLATEYLQKNPLLEELFTLEEANELTQFDLMINRARQLEKHLADCSHRDNQFHYISYRLNALRGYYTTGYVNRSDSTYLQLMLDHLDGFYLAAKLKNCCHLTANMMLMNNRFDFSFLEPLLHYVRRHWDVYSKEPSIDLYYTILLSLREEDNPDHYAHLKELMANHIDSFSPEERTELYEFSNNYCIRQINSGNSEYQRELFQLYVQGLRNDLLLNNGILTEWVYKNIVTLGCKLKEFEWTENFIEEYRHKLPLNRQENAYKYNLANLYYNKQMYEETLSTLLHVQFTDVKYHLNTNFLLLRTYYAMQDTEVLLSHIETFRIYVIRNRKMTTEQKRGYTNFLRYAKKLVLIKHQPPTFSKKSQQEKLDQLARKIRETENVINSYWLLEECEGQPVKEWSGQE